MTTEQKIEQGAKEHDNRFQPPIEQFTYWRVNSFTAGASFYREQILPGVMEQFAEWVRTFEALERQNGQWVIESQLSDKDIVKAFLSHLKQKDGIV